MQHIGEMIVEGSREVFGQVTGTTFVRAGGFLIARGQLSGGLIIDKGGHAVIHGQVSRNVINNGSLELLGQVSGRVIGNQPLNLLVKDQIVGLDLEVPLRGHTTSWSTTWSD